MGGQQCSSIHLHYSVQTRCISNNFTSVSYQIAGSTFLDREERKKFQNFHSTRSSQQSPQTSNISLPTCKCETMLSFRCSPDTFESKWDEELVTDRPVCHAARISKFPIHRSGLCKERINLIDWSRHGVTLRTCRCKFSPLAVLELAVVS